MQYKRNIDAPTSYIYIDYSDLSANFDLSDLEPMIFQITLTYANTKHPDPAKWSPIAEPINKFFSLITDYDQVYILKAINKAVKTLNEEFGIIQSNPTQYNIINVMKKVGNVIVELDNQISLCRKLSDYVDQHIYVGDFSNAGNNPQDRSTVTYKESEAQELVTICMLSKLLFPIFGKILNQFSEYSGEYEINRSKKEIYASVVLDAVLKKNFQGAVEKLQIYVNDYVNRQYNDLKLLMDSSKYTSEDDNVFYKKDAFKHFTAGAFMGITSDSLTDSTIANLLIKAFVNGNVHENEESHVVTYMHSSVQSNISKQLGERTNNRRIYRRTDPSKSNDQETAQFEVDSIVSSQSCDIGEIIRTEVPNVIKEMILNYGTEELYENILNHHLYHKTPPNIISQVCMSKFFGEYLGGGESLLYLNHRSYCELLSAFQLYLIDMNMSQLLFAVCAKRNGRKITQTQNDITISNKYKTLDNYSYCANVKFKHCHFIFRKCVESIIETVTEYDYTYNVPDVIYEKLGIQNVNGGLIDYDLILLNQIFLIMRLQ